MRSHVTGVVLLSCLALPGLASPSTELKATGLSAPLHFERNDGQTDASVRYLARGRGYTLFLTDSEAVVSAGRDDALRVRFLGSKERPRLEAEPAPGVTNYLVGSDPSRWRTGIPHFSRVTYREVYPGVSVTYYGNQARGEFDMEVAPRANPGRIRMRFEGGQGVSIGPDGAVHARTKHGEFVQHAPVAYQLEGEERQPVPARYVLSKEGEVRLALGAYDRSRALVVDPVVSYATFLGGLGGDETQPAITTDADGNVYLTGTTASDAFAPTGYQGGTDAFVTKKDRHGTLVFSTYLGGANDDSGAGIALDGSGSVYVVGTTTSSNFPGTVGQTPPGAGDAFLTKLDAAGSTVLWSRYLGGPNSDGGVAVGVQGSGPVFVAGWAGAGFPTTHLAHAGAKDAFVAIVPSDGTAPIYATCLGGTGDDAAAGLALDGTGAVTVVGSTLSSDFPTTTGAPQTVAGGNGDGFLSRIENPTSTPSLSFSTYLGGSGLDEANGVALGPGSEPGLYVAGTTHSGDFPIAGTARQASFGGESDAFLAVFKIPEGSSVYGLAYSTYLGGSGADEGTAISLDLAGNVYLAGHTQTSSVEAAFPLRSSLKPPAAGDQDVFVSKLDITASGEQIRYSTLLGGSAVESQPALAVSAAGVAYVAGETLSDAFPVTNGVSRADQGQTTKDLFVLKLGEGDPGSDFNADLKWDVLWFQDSTGAIWLSNGTSLLGGALLPTVAGGWEPAGAGDFDGDDKVDILWRNAGDGQNAIWGMNGTIIASGDFLSTVQPPWRMDLIGDFDGDGREDIFWRQPNTGDNAIWFMNGAQVKSAGLTTSVTDTDWMVVEAADFDGNGTADVLWRNVQTGGTSVWFMDGLTITGAKALDTPGMSWSVPGVVDFNGDGKADILWRNVQNGQNAVWFMNGMGDFSSASLPTVGPEWEPIAAGDFNGDGKGDIFWRHGTGCDPVTGACETVVWFMNGATVVSSAPWWGVTTDWQVVAPRARMGGSTPIPATPEFDPVAGDYGQALQVHIGFPAGSTPPPGTVIRYTVNGDQPTETSLIVGASGVSVASNTTLKASAFRFWTLPGPLAEATYTFTYALSVSQSGTGSGTVTSSPAGIDCGSDCSEAYPSGTSVTLTATPSPGSTFDGWGGACSGTGACIVTMDAAKSVMAGFRPSGTSGIEEISWTHVVNAAASGSTLTRAEGTGWDAGAVSSREAPSGDVCADYRVSNLTDRVMFGLSNGDPDQNYTGIDFATYGYLNELWVFENGVGYNTHVAYAVGDRLGVCSEGGQVKYYLNGTAVYTSIVSPTYPLLVDTSLYDTGAVIADAHIWGAGLPPAHALSVSRSGFGSGTVTSSPAGIDCGTSCNAAYAIGTSVTLTATPSGGSTFEGWVGACAGPGACTLTMDAAKSVTASFGRSGEYPKEPVSWTHVVNASAAGSTLTRLAGSEWDAGAVSNRLARSGDVCADYKVSSMADSVMFGLSNGDADQGYADIDFAIYGYLNKVWVYEGGTPHETNSPYAVDDRLGVCVEGGQVRYYQNGTVVYTSGTAPTYPLLVDTSLHDTGAVIADARMWGPGVESPTGTYALSVSRCGSGSGLVTSSPAGIDCGSDCSEMYASGTSVTLTAAAASGSTFSGWSGACAGTAECTVEMNALRWVTARFDAVSLPGPTCQGGTQVLTYRGTAQGFVVPANCTSVRVKTWGAGGGSAPSTIGGGGGYAQARISVTPGEVLTVIVGGGGDAGQNSDGGLGGYGGGGNGGSSASSRSGAGGGGRSALSRGVQDLVSAGGGGGSSGASWGYAAGGAGGGLAGAPGEAVGEIGGGEGGTQTSGGAGGAGETNGQPGGSLQGGLGGSSQWVGNGGGGGGFFGGGAGGLGNVEAALAGGGGGGSGHLGTDASGTLEAGSGWQPAAPGDAERAGAGSGGLNGVAGAAGRVVLSWGPNVPPQVSVQGASCHIPCTATFVATVTNLDFDTLTYSWEGCAAGQTGPTATCPLSTVGTVQATVTVDDGQGGTATASALASGTNEAPTLQFQGPSSCHAPCTVDYTATATDPDGDAVVLTWGDCAAGQMGPTATCSLAMAETQAISVTATDGLGGVSTRTALIHATNAAPVDVTVTPSDSSYTVPCNAEFTAAAIDPDEDPLVFIWSGCAIGQRGDTAYCQVNTAGAIIAIVTASDGRGGQATASAQVTCVLPQQNVPPVADPGGPYVAQAERAVAFDGRRSRDPDGVITLYQWAFGDGQADTGPTPRHAYAATGTYTVVLTVTDDDNAVSSVNLPLTVSQLDDKDGDGLTDQQEAELGSDPNDADSNDDGILDGAAWALWSDPTRLTDLDVDDDGSLNADEFVEGTDPFNPDTDGDDIDGTCKDGPDAFPLDPLRCSPLQPDPNDHTGPIIILTNPEGLQ